MITEFFVEFLTGMLAGLTGVSDAIIELFYRKGQILKKDKKQHEILSKKIEKLTNSLHDASVLMTEIEEEFEKQRILAEKWKEEAATSQVIASMNQEEIDAVSKIFGGQLEKESKKSSRKSLAWNVVFCFIGIIGGYVISKLLP